MVGFVGIVIFWMVALWLLEQGISKLIQKRKQG